MRKTKSAGDEIVMMDRRSTKDRRTETRAKATETKPAATKAVAPKGVAPKSAAVKTATPKSSISEPSESSVKSNSDRRNPSDRRHREPMPENMAKLIAEEKRKVRVQRRRQIDPTTCERDYSGDEIAFMQAMDEYKRKNGRMFPTCSEILEVVRSIGYVKASFDEPTRPSPNDD
jgi:hypothetical protein